MLMSTTISSTTPKDFCSHHEHMSAAFSITSCIAVPQVLTSVCRHSNRLLSAPMSRDVWRLITFGYESARPSRTI